MKPIVGIMPLWDEEKNSIWMLPGYMDGIAQAGAIPIIFPFSSDKDEISRLVRICDGILFTGGQDVSPKMYGEEPLNGLVTSCEKRDAMEIVELIRDSPLYEYLKTRTLNGKDSLGENGHSGKSHGADHQW